MLKSIAPFAPVVPAAPFKAAPVPAPSPQSHAPASAETPHPFAEMLRRNRSPTASAEPAAANQPISTPVAPTADAATEQAPTDPAKTAQASRARLHTVPTPPRRREAEAGRKLDKTEAAAADAKPAAQSAADSANGAQSGVVATWVCELLPVPTSVADAATRAAGGDTTDDVTDDPSRTGNAAASRPRSAAGASAADPKASIADVGGRADATPGTATPASGHESLVTASTDDTPARQRGAGEPAAVRIDAVAAGAFGSAAAATLTTPAATAPTVDVMLPTPFSAAEFAQAMGVQVSLLASDGVQRAELHLNPADMGPVSVQIVLDGTQAQVDFGADVAATRHAIEAGLPELASALRDAGFTLHGGGVSEHSKPHDGDGRGSPSRMSTVIGGRGDHAHADGLEQAAHAVTGARRAALPGGVDLYA